MTQDIIQWAVLVTLGCWAFYSAVAIAAMREQMRVLPNHTDLSETNQRLARVETRLDQLANNIETIITMMQDRK
ncbi:hypothetical protein HC761_00200 [bacterium]|nr:hypothetical protein [bacterium]